MSETPAAHVPPQNLEAEESVLGAMLLSEGAVAAVQEIVRADHFYRQSHGLVYQAALDLYGKGTPVDAITMVDELEKRGQLEEVGGRARIHELAALVPATANAAHYARLVRESATLRGLVRVGSELTRLGHDKPGDLENLLDQAERLVFGLTQDGLSPDLEVLRPALVAVFERMSTLAHSKSDVVGLPSGFHSLDRLTLGFQPGNLVILAARPSMGKSALSLAFAANVAVRAQLPVAFFTLEMSKSEVAERLLATEANVELRRVRTGRANPEEWARLTAAAEHLDQAPLYLDDASSQTMVEIRSKARRLKAQKPELALIVVDYLQLLVRGRHEHKVAETGEIARQLKQLAGDLKLPVIALAQLSRNVEHRPDKRPVLSDLRDCVTGDTRVLLADGRRPMIRDLVGARPDVLAVSPEQRLVTATADKVWRVGRRPVHTVALTSGRAVRATARHRFLTGAGWRRLDELQVGDRVAVARSLPEPPETVEWPDARVVLLGHLVGDGSYLVGQPLNYTTADEACSAAVKEAAEQAFGATVKRRESRGRWHQLIISGNGNRWHIAGVNAWLAELGIRGQRSAEKHLPDDVFRFSDRQAALLLQHLWATDGCIHSRARGPNSIFFATASRRLADDVAVLLLRFGVVARIALAKDGAYTVKVTGADGQRAFLERVGAFANKQAQADKLAAILTRTPANTNVDTVPREVGAYVRATIRARGISQREWSRMRGVEHNGSAAFAFSPSRDHVAKYSQLLDDPHLHEWAASDLFWDCVSAVTPAGEEDVYDLTVPGAASWLADGIVSHNSGEIEQHADLVAFLYRDDYYNKDTTDGGIAELNLAKHRNGPTEMVKLAWRADRAKFTELAPERAA